VRGRVGVAGARRQTCRNCMIYRHGILLKNGNTVFQGRGPGRFVYVSAFFISDDSFKTMRNNFK
jgi:hypothetical protein